MTAAWDLTVQEASARIALGELSVCELLEAVIARLDETEPTLQAWASVDLSGAMAAAAEADRRIETGGSRGPLDGIPIGLKDVIDTKGWPTEAGSRALRGNVPKADADVVASLRRAGAIILGKNVTHEFAYGQNTPPTRNPWDVRRYPGGSSVGSGVAVAAGSAMATLGTDTGGSVRNPAAVNGLVGLCPTSGLVSLRGVIPVSQSLDQVGPIAKTVADCAIVLDAIAQTTGGPDANAESDSYLEALDRPLGRLRIGVDRESWANAGVEADVERAVAESIKVFADRGDEIVEISMPMLEHALPTGVTLFLCEAYMWHRDLLRRRSSDYEPGTRVMLALGALVAGADYVHARSLRERIRAEVRAVFEREDLDVVLSPTLPWAAPAADELLTDLTRPGGAQDLTGALRLLSWANVCGLPALSLPCGVSAEGLPLGLQLIGRPFREDLLLRAAFAYEAVTPWHGLRAPESFTAGPL